MPLRTRRWNDAAEDGDGLRVLVCRFRPRGVSKEKETWDGWCPHLGPSVALHAAYWGKTGAPIGFDAYRRRFIEEMAPQGFWLDGFAERLRKGETLTLLCSSACVDPAQCHRTVLVDLLNARLAPKPPSETTVMVRRRRS